MASAGVPTRVRKTSTTSALTLRSGRRRIRVLVSYARRARSVHGQLQLTAKTHPNTRLHSACRTWAPLVSLTSRSAARPPPAWAGHPSPEGDAYAPKRQRPLTPVAAVRTAHKLEQEHHPLSAGEGTVAAPTKSRRGGTSRG